MGCGASKEQTVNTAGKDPEASPATLASQPEAGAAKKQPVAAESSVKQQNGNSASTVKSDTSGGRPRLSSYASTGDDQSSNGSVRSSASGKSDSKKNPKKLMHSTSAVGLDEMIELRRENGDLGQNVVHIEVPFGKPIEEVYEGVHSGPVLGSGISGLVRLVTHKATGVQYAVKCLDLGLVDTAEGLKQLREEIFIMCQLDHPNIVRLEEVYESHSEIYLVQELCLGGELFDRLDEQPDYHYTESECARLVKNMLNAVRYLHSKGIIHRDLKLENFLFSSTSQDSELKMIDFGLSKHFRYGEQQHEAVGTPYTVAPEVIRGCYDERCDIWAIGVITFLLLSGDPPFGGCGGPEPLMTVRANILKGQFYFEPEDVWAGVSSLARDFIKTLLVIDPKLRPTARDAQKHRWLMEWANRSKKEGDNILNPNVVKALVSFKEFSDMRKLLCEVLSFTLLPDQIKDLRKEFEKLDTDGSGEISLAALKEVLMTNAGQGSLGALTEEEVEDIFNAMRVKKTETRIHWHEFIAAGLSQCQVDDRNLRLAFERLDIDHKGYITLDDIMELMGNDDLLSEEALEGMWADSMEQAKCPNARITYDDFLLLMKGQSTEAAPIDPMELSMSSRLNGSKLLAVSGADLVDPLENSMSRLQSAKLLTVKEGEQGFKESTTSPEPSKEDDNMIVLPSGDVVNADGTIVPAPAPPVSIPIMPALPPIRRSITPRSESPVVKPHSAPVSPAKAMDGSPDELDSPLSMDDDEADEDTIRQLRNLTPPQTPTRGAADYITPQSGRRQVDLNLNNIESIAVPGLPSKPPTLYIRRRSRSVDDKDKEMQEKEAAEKEKEGIIQQDSRRAMMLPEHNHDKKEFDALVRDESKSALQVNRKLYRAHRQMRLAVLEASKRFEEQQAQHAKEVLMAKNEREESINAMNRPYHAGLVMRHGNKKVVTSEAIKKMLQDNQNEQQALVEMATRRGGRGRRTRKKTISDMSGMLTGASLTQEEMGRIAVAAASPAHSVVAPQSEEFRPKEPMGGSDRSLGRSNNTETVPTVPEEDIVEHQVRDPTVPGNFLKTSDPFGANGLYGNATKRTSWAP
ncbi:MAP kinase-activated protein kinase 2 (Fragment) [Seminavis robusta]|uniref:MAP kinase-activated protein kinase 2 n=1 Tax=Seminavis robusta TaxID=568900 RepID=A0A9N8HLB4_9STRA